MYLPLAKTERPSQDPGQKGLMEGKSQYGPGNWPDIMMMKTGRCKSQDNSGTSKQCSKVCVQNWTSSVAYFTAINY